MTPNESVPPAKTVPMMQSHEVTKESLDLMLTDQRVRTEICRSSHYWFFHVYFNEYVKYPTAPFQREMFSLTEDVASRLAVIMAFRGSGKSTIMTLSYPIWAVLGAQQKKFIVILSQTQQQAKLHLTNLKREMESNDLLRMDLGPFEEKEEEWSSGSLVIPKHGARITAISAEQSIRGLRHGSHRPDLIICDDVEDLGSVKTREGRSKTYSWFTGDVVPAGDRDTKTIVVGNLLHEDSLLMRLQVDIKMGRLDGEIRAYPLFEDDTAKTLWPGKFRTEEEVHELKRTIGSEVSWQREFLLRIISDEERLIQREWINYYDVLPPRSAGNYHYSATGIDLAISEKDTADYTAMVSAQVHDCEDELRVYILPNPVNERMDFPTTVARAQAISRTIADGSTNYLFIEEVGYQGALIQELSRKAIHAEGVKVHGQDKRARLALVTHLVQTGKVLFPRKGAERLIEQLVGFGTEKHDDLSDAFAILLHKVLEKNHPRPQIIGLGSYRPSNSIFEDGPHWKPLSDWGKGIGRF